MTLIATIAAAATASWDPTFFGLCHRTAGLRCSRFLVNDVSLWIWTKRICLHTSLPFCVQYLCIHVCDGMNAYDYNMELPSAEYTNIGTAVLDFLDDQHWTCQCKFIQRNTCRLFRAVGVWIWIFIFTYHGFWESRTQWWMMKMPCDRETNHAYKRL